MVGPFALALALGGIACSSHKGSSVVAADAGVAAVGSLSPEQASQVLARVGDHTITLGDYAVALQHMDQFDRTPVLGASAPQGAPRRDDRRPASGRRGPREGVRQGSGDRSRSSARSSATRSSRRRTRALLRRATSRRPRSRRTSTPTRPTSTIPSAGASRSSFSRTPSPSRPRGGRQGESRQMGRARPDPVGRPASEGRTVPLELAGDLGFVSPPGDPRGVNPRVPEEVRAAVFEIAKVGDVLPRLVPAAGASPTS